MHTARRFRSLCAALALAALFLVPWPAAAAGSPIFSFTGWLAGLWAEGLIWDPNGRPNAEPESTPTTHLTWDPNGGATPPAGTDNADAGLLLDPDGRP